MRPRIAILMTVLVFGSAAPMALAEPPKGPASTGARLSSFDDLQGRLGAPTLRLLDARPRAEYDKGHLPGAVWLNPRAAEELASRPGGLTDRAAWEAWIAPLAIGPETEVIVYDANRQRDAARFWWLLSYLGVEKVGLMDGGFPLWSGDGRPVTTEVPQVRPRPFAVRFRHDRHATRADVLEAIQAKRTRVIDARSEAEHTGAQRLAKRAGRIPGAFHLEWAELVDRDGRFLDEAALRARLSRAGVVPGEPVITHCQSGGRASLDAFVCERLGSPARIYYLGWSDWGNADETPVEAETQSNRKR